MSAYNPSLEPQGATVGSRLMMAEIEASELRKRLDYLALDIGDPRLVELANLASELCMTIWEAQEQLRIIAGPPPRIEVLRD